MTIGETIRKVRYEEGLTQQSLSIITGLTERFINYIEHDKKKPSLRTLTKIADAVDKNMKIIYSPGKKVTHVSFFLRDTIRVKSFDERITELENRLYFDCLKLCKYNKDDAKDLKQEAICQALIYHYRFNESSQLYTWLYRIAKNIHCADFDKDKYLTYVNEYFENGDIVDEIKHNISLTKYINKLDAKSKQLYTMRLMGMPYTDIANQLRVTHLSAKSKFWKIKKRLLQLMETDTKKPTYENN